MAPSEAAVLPCGQVPGPAHPALVPCMPLTRLHNWQTLQRRPRPCTGCGADLAHLTQPRWQGRATAVPGHLGSCMPRSAHPQCRTLGGAGSSWRSSGSGSRPPRQDRPPGGPWGHCTHTGKKVRSQLSTAPLATTACWRPSHITALGTLHSGVALLPSHGMLQEGRYLCLGKRPPGGAGCNCSHRVCSPVLEYMLAS